MRAFLVRHGEVENPDRVVYGRLPGFRLSADGRAQLERTRAWLTERTSLEGARWYSSPLERAAETAEILAGEGAAIRIDARLLEASSPFDGLPRRFAPHLYVGRWLDAAERPEPPARVVRRMMEVIRAAASKGEDAILVSHQFPIQLARIGFAHRIDARPTWLVERAPWTVLRAPCAVGSVTTLTFPHRGLVDPRIDYWAPG